MFYDEVASLKKELASFECIFGGDVQAEIRGKSLLFIFLAFVGGLGLVSQAAATKKV